jgi:type I restriction enzyme S subunit
VIANLKPYLAMKDSGVPWLGAVPKHWEVRRLKYLLRERDLRSSEGTEQLLRVSQFTGVTERRRADGGDEPDTRAESLVGYKRVEPNDLVVNIMLAWNGSMGVSSFAGIASPAYCVYRFEAPAQPWYFHHLLRSPAYKARIKAVSTGVVESRLRLYTDDLYRLEALLPPLSEQAAIVRFLDHADRRIRRYIRAKQKLIKLLEEQKQAIIHRAVTRGLDLNVRLKSSGVEWLGDVPEHWDVWQVGHFAAVGNGSTPSRGNSSFWTNGTYPWLNSSSVNAGEILASDQFVTATALRECHLPRVPVGSVLVAITGQGKTRGSAAVLRIEATINQHIAFITPRKRAISDYLHKFLIASYSELRRLSDNSGSTKGALTCEDLRHFRVALPPIAEQHQIVQWTQDAITEAEAPLRFVESEISLLREYRTRLIADVVTGKLDVREAASQLPDEVPEMEAVDELDDGAETDEAADFESATDMDAEAAEAELA